MFRHTDPETFIRLNVRGRIFTTKLRKLISGDGNKFSEVFFCEDRFREARKDSWGDVYLDRDPSVFAHLIDFLEDGRLPPAAMRAKVLKEALYWKIRGLITALELCPSITSMKESLCKCLPRFEEIKWHILQQAAEDIKRSHQLLHNEITLTVVRKWVSGKDSFGSDYSSVAAHFRSQDDFSEIFASPNSITIPVEEVKLDGNEREVRGQEIKKFMLSIASCIANDFIEDGFRVSVFENKGVYDDRVVNPKKTTEWFTFESKIHFNINILKHNPLK